MLGCFSRVWLFATLRTVAHQAPPTMGFCRQEYLSGMPSCPPGDPKYRTWVSCGSCTAGRFFTAEPPGKPLYPLLLPSFFPDENSCFILEKSNSLPGVTYQVREKAADAFQTSHLKTHCRWHAHVSPDFLITLEKEQKISFWKKIHYWLSSGEW